MRISEVSKLAEIMRDFSLSRLEIRDGEHGVLIERAAPAAATNTAIQTAAGAGRYKNDISDENIFTYTSPMVGVYYCAPAPDAAPYVSAGMRVSRGDVLGIIEAMKLMNEIAAEESGEVVEILVKNGDVVEFGQPMFVFRRGGAA